MNSINSFLNSPVEMLHLYYRRENLGKLANDYISFESLWLYIKHDPTSKPDECLEGIWKFLKKELDSFKKKYVIKYCGNAFVLIDQKLEPVIN